MKERRTSENEIIECLSYLKNHDLENYVKEEVADSEGDAGKAKHNKDLIEAKRIIFVSIKHHLISHVSSLNIPKEMFDEFTVLHEGKNINMKMTLKNQLNDVKMKISESIQSYFTRVSQIKEQPISY